MPINRLLKDSNLAPEEQQALKQAFDRSLRKLHLVNRNDPVCEIVAHKIIEIEARCPQSGCDLRDSGERARPCIARITANAIPGSPTPMAQVNPEWYLSADRHWLSRQ